MIATPCLLWTRSINSSGYGTQRVGDRVEMAHRVAWSDAHGPIPPGHQIDHLCSVRACVNPEHLQVVTLSENSRLKEARYRDITDTPRMATTASIQLRYTRGGEPRWKVRFRDRAGAQVFDRSRTFHSEGEALEFAAGISERHIDDLVA